MKKSAKFYTALTCVTLASGLIFPSLGGVYADEAEAPETPAPAAYSYAETIDQFAVSGFQQSYAIGQTVTIPAIAKVGDAEFKANMTVYDPSNKALVKNTSEAFEFAPTKIGDYRVVYTLPVGDKQVKVAEKIISVTKEAYYFEFAKNTDRIIPSEMNLTVSDKVRANGFDGTIKLPNPELFSNKTKEKEEGAVITVSVKKPDVSEPVVLGTSNNLTFKPEAVGEYIFTYTARVSGVQVAKKQFVLDVNNTYNNEYALEYTFSSTKPTSAVLGEATTLPGVNATNKETGEAVDVFYTISVTKGGVDKSSMVSNGVFTPTEKGDYVIKYEIKNVFGTKADSFSFTIKDVKDTKSPVVYYGYLKDGEVVDQSHEVPTKFGTTNIVLPAIYATDNSGDEISYKRQIYRVKTTDLDKGKIGDVDSKKPIIINYKEDEFADKANITNYVIFNYADNSINTAQKKEKALEAGIYTVSYTAIDSSNYDSTKSYTMTLEDAIEESVPTIDFSTVLPSEVKIGESISFDVPTAKDEKDDRLVVKTEYRFGNTGDWTELKNADSGKYTIEAKTAGVLNIKVSVKNDFGKKAEVTKSVNVLSIEDDSVAPELVAGYPDFTESQVQDVNDQFSEITLPKMMFNDNKGEKYLKVTVVVSDKDGNPVTVYGKKTKKVDGVGIEVSGAKFKASKSGEYTVAYCATDLAGNSYVYSFKTNSVRSTVAPTIVNPIFSSSVIDLELGETLNLPIPSVKDGDGATIDNPTYDILILDAEGDYEPVVANKFKPLEVGKYKLQFVVYDSVDPSLQTTSAEYTVDVKNSKAPKIMNEFDEYTSVAKGTAFNVPRAEISTDGLGDVDWANSKIEMMFNGSVYRTWKLDATYDNDQKEAEAYTYNLSRDGTYTLKYTVSDVAGNTATKSFDIKVGDTIKPVLDISKDIDFGDRNVGSKLVIDPGKLTISDNSDTDEDKIDMFKDLTIVVKNTSTGVTISNNYKNENQIDGYEFDLDEVGTYQVTFTLKDGAGNKTSVVKEFVVTAKEAEKKFPTQAVGIILLVLACLVLGGVVAYFIITRKKAKSPEKIKKAKEKKDKKAKK